MNVLGIPKEDSRLFWCSFWKIDTMYMCLRMKFPEKRNKENWAKTHLKKKLCKIIKYGESMVNLLIAVHQWPQLGEIKRSKDRAVIFF